MRITYRVTPLDHYKYLLFITMSGIHLYDKWCVRICNFLTPKQRQHHVGICKNLHQQNQDDPDSMSRIIIAVSRVYSYHQSLFYTAISKQLLCACSPPRCLYKSDRGGAGVHSSRLLPTVNMHLAHDCGACWHFS